MAGQPRGNINSNNSINRDYRTNSNDGNRLIVEVGIVRVIVLVMVIAIVVIRVGNHDLHLQAGFSHYRSPAQLSSCDQ